jgi:hypothetical protein
VVRITGVEVGPRDVEPTAKQSETDGQAMPESAPDVAGSTWLTQVAPPSLLARMEGAMLSFSPTAKQTALDGQVTWERALAGAGNDAIGLHAGSMVKEGNPGWGLLPAVVAPPAASTTLSECTPTGADLSTLTTTSISLELTTVVDSTAMPAPFLWVSNEAKASGPKWVPWTRTRRWLAPCRRALGTNAEIWGPGAPRWSPP